MSDQWIADFRRRYQLDLAVTRGEESDQVAARAELARAYARKHIPRRYVGALPCHQEVEQWVADVVRRGVEQSRRHGRLAPVIHDGPSLLLYGERGVGKTHAAYGALRVLGLLGIHVRWLAFNAPELYERLRPGDGQLDLATVSAAPILLINDFGAANATQWVKEVTFRLVDYRYEQNLPTILTTNFDLPRLEKLVGDRVTDRLAEVARRVQITGPNRRRNPR